SSACSSSRRSATCSCRTTSRRRCRRSRRGSSSSSRSCCSSASRRSLGGDPGFRFRACVTWQLVAESDDAAHPSEQEAAVPEISADDRGSVSGLFQLLRDGAPRTRAELAKQTGLARSTIATRVDMLMRMGLIVPVGDGVSTGGRPPSQFALNPAARLVVAADLGASHATVALSDLTGAVLVERAEPVAIAQGPDVVLSWLAESARALLAEIGRAESDVAAVGIGLPGPVEFSTGRPFNPPIMPGWDRFDVPGWMREHFDVPVLVDNDVNISALGERAVAWPDVDHLMFVKVATGIGSGIISDGYLQRGSRGSAGDIGHVRVARGGDAPCTCGNTGCLEIGRASCREGG